MKKILLVLFIVLSSSLYAQWGNYVIVRNTINGYADTATIMSAVRALQNSTASISNFRNGDIIVSDGAEFKPMGLDSAVLNVVIPQDSIYITGGITDSVIHISKTIRDIFITVEQFYSLSLCFDSTSYNGKIYNLYFLTTTTAGTVTLKVNDGTSPLLFDVATSQLTNTIVPTAYYTQIIFRNGIAYICQLIK